MITREMVFEIHRLHHEGYSERQIAKTLQLNRKTVSRYLENPDSVKSKQKRGSKLDPFKEEIQRLLEINPTASAVVIKQKLDDMGYDGGISILKDYLKTIRKKTSRMPCIRFESKPGEQMQIDWGHFGSLVYGRDSRKLYAFAMVEGYSRMLYVEFTHSQKQSALHQCLLNGFRFFGGCPKELVVDNMITAVTERMGSVIRFNDAFLDFLRPFRVTPRACNIRSPQEKGKVENSIRYLRRNFWPLRSFSDLLNVNEQVRVWMDKTANIRVHQTTGEQPQSRAAKLHLQPLPSIYPDVRETCSLKVYTDFAVRFDINAYTVPPWTVGKNLILKADSYTVKIYLKEKKLAVHKRSYEKKKRIETSYHREQAKKLKKKMWHDKDIAVISSLGSEAIAYLNSISDAGLPIKKNVSRLLKLKDEYGKESLLIAIRKAMAHNAFGADYVENILYQEMTPIRTYPPVKLKKEELNRIRLEEPSLADYDAYIIKKGKIKNG